MLSGPQCHTQRCVVAAGNDRFCPDPRNQDHAGVHEKLHNGRVERQQPLSGGITLIDTLRNAFEFLIS